MRLRCHLLGCRDLENYPACERCGACWNYGEQVDGWLPYLWWRSTIIGVWLTWPAYWLLGQRCLVCRKRLWPWSAKSHDEFCSEECFGEWIPF